MPDEEILPVPSVQLNGGLAPGDAFPSLKAKSLPPGPDPASLDTPGEREAYLKAFDPVGGTFGSQVAAGVANFGAGLSGFGEIASSAIPFVGPITKPYFKKWGDWFRETAAYQPRLVPSVSNIRSVGDAGTYASESIGNMLGYMAPTVLASLLLPGSGTAAAAGPKGQIVAADLSSNLGKIFSNPAFLKTAGLVGSTEAGLAYQSIRDETGREMPVLASMVGALNGVLEAAPVFKGLDKVLGSASQEARKKFTRNYIGDVIDTAVSHGLLEGATEAAQEANTMMAERFAANNWNFKDGKDLLRLTDAFLAGAIGGSAMAGAGRAVARPFVGTQTTQQDVAAPQFSGLSGTLQAPLTPAPLVTPAQATAGLNTPVEGVFQGETPFDAAIRQGARAQQQSAAAPIVVEASNRTAQDATGVAASALAVAKDAAEIAANPSVPIRPNVELYTPSQVSLPVRPPTPDVRPIDQITEDEYVAQIVDRMSASGVQQIPPSLIEEIRQDYRSRTAAPAATPKRRSLRTPKPKGVSGYEEKQETRREVLVSPPQVEAPAPAVVQPTPVPVAPRPEPVPSQPRGKQAKMSKKKVGSINDLQYASIQRLKSASSALEIQEIMAAFRAELDAATGETAIDKGRAAKSWQVFNKEADRQYLRVSAESQLSDKQPHFINLRSPIDGRETPVRVVYDPRKDSERIQLWTADGSRKLYSARGDAIKLENPTSHDDAVLAAQRIAQENANNRGYWQPGRITSTDPVFQSELKLKSSNNDAWMRGLIASLSKVNDVSSDAAMSIEMLWSQLDDAEKSQLVEDIRRLVISRNPKLSGLPPSKLGKHFHDAVKVWQDSTNPGQRLKPETFSAAIKSVRQTGSTSPNTREALIQKMQSEVDATHGSLVDDKLISLLDDEGLKIVTRYASEADDREGRVDQFISEISSHIRANFPQTDPIAVAEIVKDVAQALYDKTHKPDPTDQDSHEIVYRRDYTPEWDPENPPSPRTFVGPEILDAIQDSRYGFSKAMVDATKRILSVLGGSGGIFDGLTLQIVPTIKDGHSDMEISGSYSSLMRTIRIAIDKAQDDTVAHEMLHAIWDMVPQEMRDQVHDLWFKALRKELDANPDTVLQGQMERALNENGLNGYDFIGRMDESGTEPTQDELNRAAPYYHLNNEREYFVHNMLLVDPPGTTLAKIKDFVGKIVDAVLSALGSEAAIFRQIARRFRTGEYSTATRSRIQQNTHDFQVASTAKQASKIINSKVDPNERIRQAASIYMQSAPFADIVMSSAKKLFGGMSARMEALTGFTRAMATASTVKSVVDSARSGVSKSSTPSQIMDALTDPSIPEHDKMLYAHDYVVAFNRFMKMLSRRRASVDKLKASMRKPGYVAKFKRLENLRTEYEDVKERTLARMRDFIRDSISRLTKDLEESARTGGETSRILAELEFWKKHTKDYRGTGGAMEGGIFHMMSHIMDVLASTSQGRGLLFGDGEITPQQVKALYDTVAEAADANNLARIDELLTDPDGNPILGSKHTASLMSAIRNYSGKRLSGNLDAAYTIIARMRSLSRDLAAIGMLAETAPGYQRFVEEYSRDYADMVVQLQDDPVRFAKSMSDKLAREASKNGWIGHAMAALNREVTMDARRLNDYRDSVTIMEDALKSSSLQRAADMATRQIGAIPSEVADASPEYSWSDPATGTENGQQYKMFPTPTGEWFKLFIGLDRRAGASQQREFESYIASINNWLMSEDGRRSPYRKWWENGVKIAETMWQGDNMYDVNPQVLPFMRNLTIPQWVYRDIGGPLGKLLQISMNNWDAAHKRIRERWSNNQVGKIKAAIMKAAQSHSDYLEGDTESERIIDWFRRVKPHIAGYANTQGSAPVVGYQLMPGLKVTKEDIDALQFEVESTDRLYEILKETGVRQGFTEPATITEDVAGVKITRPPLKLTRWMLPRTYSPEALAVANDWVREVQDRNGKAAIYARAVDILNTRMDLVASFLRDRNQYSDGDFSNQTYWDAYDDLRNGRINDFNDLVSFFMSDATAKNMGQVRESLINEFHRLMMRATSEKKVADDENQNFFKPDKAGNIDVLSGQNSFNSARREATLPYFFYDYGFGPEYTYYQLVGGAQEYYAKQFFSAVTTALKGLKQENNALQARMSANGHRATRDEIKRSMDLRYLIDSLGEVEVNMRKVSGLVGNVAEDESFLTSRTEVGRMVQYAIHKLVSAAITGIYTGFNNSFGNWSRSIMLYQAVNGALASLNPMASIKFLKEIPKGAAIIARGVVVGGIKGAGKILSSEENRYRAATAEFINYLANETWVRDMSIGGFNITKPYQDMVKQDIFPFYDTSRIISQMFDTPATRGTVHEPKYGGSSMGGFQKLLSGTGSFLGAAMIDIPGIIFPRGFDIISNAGSMNLAAFQANRIRNNLIQSWRAAAPGIKTRFNLSNPMDPNNLVDPELILGRGTTNTNLKWLNDMFSDAGLDLNAIAIRFWDRLDKTVESNWGDVDLLTDDQVKQFGSSMAREINISTLGNRPSKLQASQQYRNIFALYGWSSNAMAQSLRMISRHAESDPVKAKAALKVQVAMMAATMIMTAGVLGVWQWDLLRRMYWWLLGEEFRGKLPSDEQTSWGSTKRFILAASTAFPIIGIIPNVMFNDSPHTAALGMDMFLQNKVRDVIQYASGAIQSGDITYGLPELVKRTLPWTRGLVNRIPGYSGVVELQQSSALLNRYGPDELIRTPGGGSGYMSTATELTPYGRSLVDAAMNEDWATFDATWAEAVDVARKLGKADPEDSVRQMYEMKNPTRQAFKLAPSQQQMDTVMGRMNDRERAQFMDSMARYAAGANRIGGRGEYARNQSVPVEQWLSRGRQEMRQDQQSQPSSPYPVEGALPTFVGAGLPGQSSRLSSLRPGGRESFRRSVRRMKIAGPRFSRSKSKRRGRQARVLTLGKLRYPRTRSSY